VQKKDQVQKKKKRKLKKLNDIVIVIGCCDYCDIHIDYV